MEENKVAQDWTKLPNCPCKMYRCNRIIGEPCPCPCHSSAPNSPDLTGLSGEQAEERTAREGRLPEIDGYFVESETKWLRLPNGNLIDTEATAAEISFYAECSRLASRNEQLVKEANSYAEVISYISEIVNGTPECHYLVIADDVQRMRDRLASRVAELETKLGAIMDVYEFYRKFENEPNDLWHLRELIRQLGTAVKMTPDEVQHYIKFHIHNWRLASRVEELEEDLRVAEFNLRAYELGFNALKERVKELEKLKL